MGKRIRVPALGLILVVSSIAAAQSPASGDLTGTWSGSAKLRSDGASPCEYVGSAEPGAVTLRIVQAGAGFRGSLTLDLAAGEGSPCPPIRANLDIPEIAISGSSVAFRDASGHEWTLGLRAGALQGLVSWKPGAGPAPAAAAVPRLTGEVALRRASADRSGSRPAAAASSSGLLGVGSIVAANVVGLGAFAAVNVLTNESTQSQAQATCSPRVCLFAGLTDPCLCNANVVSGASCLGTTSGAAAATACNASSVPCQAGLSCNNGVCEDAGGRCPF